MDWQKLLGYDRQIVEWTNQHRIKSLDSLFIFITDTTYIVAVLVTLSLLCIALFKRRKLLKRKAAQLGIALICNTIFVTLLKYIVNRQRPFIDDPLITKLSSGGSPSFPSGHTADAFVVAMSFTLLFRNKTRLAILLWLWVLAVAYSRVALGVHYLSDILGSVGIGVLSTKIAYWIYQYKWGDKRFAHKIQC